MTNSAAIKICVVLAALATMAVTSTLGASTSVAALGTSSSAGDYAQTPVKQIVMDAMDAMAELESVRLSGTVREEGAILTVDILFGTSDECAGTTWEEQGSVEIMHLDGVTYFKPDAEFYTAQDAEWLMELVGDMWLTNSAADHFGDTCYLDRYIDDLALSPANQPGDPQAHMKVLGTAKIRGTLVLKLSFTARDWSRGVAYIAANEPHRILGFDIEHGVEARFTDFNVEFDVEAPAADDVFDLATDLPPED